jgi:peptidyl-prolyl cis-trans isomerase C
MRLLLSAATVVGAALVVAPIARADGDAGRRDLVVAHVGPTRTITVGELEDRLAVLPAFQRATFGADAAAVRHAFLEQVLVPEALEALGAEADRLGEALPASRAIERARSQATVRAVRARIGPASAISAADVQKYYDANRGRYDTPERLQIWRILCKTKDEAQAVLDAARKDATPKTFGDLARDHSLDKGSRLRAGNLGFIGPDGMSSEPDVLVDVALVHAAQGVRDGDLVAAPVPEGEYFSVVWRRGTIAATKRTVDQASAQIRDALWKARVKEETDALVASLRKAKLRDLSEGPIDTLGKTPVPERAWGDGGARTPPGTPALQPSGAPSARP